MPIDFPNSPSVNDQFVSGGRTWIWDGSVWKAYTQALANATVNTAAIIDGAVTSDKIANSSVTSAKIADGTIVNADVSTTAAINSTKITNWEDDQVVLSSQVFDS